MAWPAHDERGTEAQNRPRIATRRPGRPGPDLRDVGRFAEGEDVSVRVLEPGDPGAPGGRPDPDPVLVEAVVSKERHPFRRECVHLPDEVADLPAEDRLGARGHGLEFLDPQGDPVAVEHQGAGVFAEGDESQGLLVEAPGLLRSSRREERHQVRGLQHADVSSSRSKSFRPPEGRTGRGRDQNRAMLPVERARRSKTPHRPIARPTEMRPERATAPHRTASAPRDSPAMAARMAESPHVSGRASPAYWRTGGMFVTETATTERRSPMNRKMFPR